MATPAGIDHDFNFLTGIERGLEKAERNVNEIGLGGTSEIQTAPRKGLVTRNNFEAVGVNVIRAPNGMTRQKENKTRRSKR